MVHLKYIWLMLVGFIRKVTNKLPIILSYFFLVFSVTTCLIILIPNCFDRVPTLSYLISKHELPITYELRGEVKVLDESGEIVNKNVEVFVGGYHTALTTTEFNLKFSSPLEDELFVVIRYEIDGLMRVFTKCLMIEDGSHLINEVFIIYA